jgi:hypothetical protein
MSCTEKAGGDGGKDRSCTKRGDVNSVMPIDGRRAEITSTFETAAAVSQSANFVEDVTMSLDEL